MSLTRIPHQDPLRLAKSTRGWSPILTRAISPELCERVRLAYDTGVCHPQPNNWFEALKATGGPEHVRVCILGQDPYHGPGQAHGLAFSVPRGVTIPPSLRNVFKELARDCGGPPPAHGDLGSWSDQGVLLLNTVLSVAEGKAGSHGHLGWQTVTEAILGALNHRPVVFLLWGRHAQEYKGRLVALHPDHLILEAPHPSPLSAHRGFIGCGHFSEVNRWLKGRGEAPIEWFGSLW